MAAACDATPSGAPGAESPWTAAWGHEYWASAAVQEWGRALAELVLQGAPHVAQGPEGTLLDYGCGPGVFLLSMAKNEVRVGSRTARCRHVRAAASNGEPRLACRGRARCDWWGSTHRRL